MSESAERQGFVKFLEKAMSDRMVSSPISVAGFGRRSRFVYSHGRFLRLERAIDQQILLAR
jgi:hypothetical protein